MLVKELLDSFKGNKYKAHVCISSGTHLLLSPLDQWSVKSFLDSNDKKLEKLKTCSVVSWYLSKTQVFDYRRDMYIDAPEFTIEINY